METKIYCPWLAIKSDEATLSRLGLALRSIDGLSGEYIARHYKKWQEFIEQWCLMAEHS